MKTESDLSVDFLTAPPPTVNSFDLVLTEAATLEVLTMVELRPMLLLKVDLLPFVGVTFLLIVVFFFSCCYF